MKSRSVKERVGRMPSWITVYLVLFGILVIAQLLSPGYMKPSHLSGMLRMASFYGLASAGQTLAILTGGIDLSIASTITFANVIGAQIMMNNNANIGLAFLAVLLMGVLVGVVNGAGIKLLNIPPFIMTLGVSVIVKGTFMLYTKGAPKGNAAPLLTAVCSKTLLGLSGIVWIWFALSAVLLMVLHSMKFGRYVYSVGANAQAARYSGIQTGNIIFYVYILSGIFSALTGFLLVGYTGTSYLNAGTIYGDSTIAAVVIGGTAITGGKGGYAGTIAGAIIITVIQDFLVIVNIPEAGRSMVQGLLILILVLVYNRNGKRN